MIIKRGIIQSFSASSYTASVLLFEATSHFLTDVPVSNTLDGTSGLVGAWCAVLFFDGQNPQDAVVIATFVDCPLANGRRLKGRPFPGTLLSRRSCGASAGTRGAA